MATRTMWFQAARGRAMIRNRSMRDARRFKSYLITNRSPYGRALDVGERQAFEMLLTGAVRRARAAHREWRQYRTWHAEWQ